MPATPREVTSTVVPITDPTRPVVREGTKIADFRRLPTTVWMPTGTDALPLVVFAHGYQLGPSDYARFCSTLASAGFVVAAPSFPLADAARGNGLDRGDIPEEAGDVSVVIGTLTKGPLAARIRTGAYAVVGHSDGADVALLDGYGQGRVDARLRGVVSIAPDAMTAAVSASDVPLLLVQGDADSIVPYSNSQTVFGQVSAPRGYLTLRGADHLPPIAGGTRWTPLLDASVAAFLEQATSGPVGTARSDRAINAVQALITPDSPASFERSRR
jgi:predicted dienelactone hydrolase